MPARHPPRWPRPSWHHLPLVVPPLLALLTATSLFLHSDVNAALLWSQCHARSVLRPLSRVPLVGTPACFLVSFWRAALGSLRSRALLGAVLAFVGSLLTVSTVESARRANARNRVVARPTPWWVVGNLLAGGSALVWELVLVPAFLLAGLERRRWANPAAAAGTGAETGSGDEDAVGEGREVAWTEVLAIPVAVALGFYVPSMVMLGTASPVAIGIWLFFPVYVSVIRKVIRRLLRTTMRRFRSSAPTAPSIHLETHRRSFAAVYGLPVAASLLAHGLLLGGLTRADDRKELTRSALTLIQINFQYAGLTLLYWVFVEVGWRAPLLIIASSVCLGPGAGTALGWLYREKLILSGGLLGPAPSGEDDGAADEEHGGGANEETRLLQ